MADVIHTDAAAARQSRGERLASEALASSDQVGWCVAGVHDSERSESAFTCVETVERRTRFIAAGKVRGTGQRRLEIRPCLIALTRFELRHRKMVVDHAGGRGAVGCTLESGKRACHIPQFQQYPAVGIEQRPALS